MITYNRNTNIRATLILLATILPASTVCGQFVFTSIGIGPKVKVENILPFALEPYLDSDSGTQMLRGIKAWQISANENLIVNATVKHDGKLASHDGYTLPLTSWLAYRNDGGKPRDVPSQKLNNGAEFMMSNSRLLVRNMRPKPKLLNAFLYLGTQMGMPQYANTTFVGSIQVKIEFN